jgi:hypothetical protein
MRAMIRSEERQLKRMQEQAVQRQTTIDRFRNQVIEKEAMKDCLNTLTATEREIGLSVPDENLC